MLSKVSLLSNLLRRLVYFLSIKAQDVWKHVRKNSGFFLKSLICRIHWQMLTMNRMCLAQLRSWYYLKLLPAYFISDGRIPSTWNVAHILSTLYSFKKSKKKYFLPDFLLASTFLTKYRTFCYFLWITVFFMFFVLSPVKTNPNTFL